MITQGAFNLLFRPGLRADFRDSYEQWETEYSEFLKTGTTSEPEQRATIMAGLSRLVERGDGEAITYFDPKLGPQVLAMDKEFAAGTMVTRRTVEDDKYGKANQGAKLLAHAARLTMEYRGAAFLDDFFTGTYFKGPDNLAFGHAAHTLLNSGSTLRNIPSSAVELSEAGINGLMDLWTVLKDENGDPIKAWPDTLIIGTNPGDINTALAILNSKLQPFTADNTDNVTRRRLPNLKLVTSHYKANAKHYWLMSSRLNTAELLVRRPVEFDDTFDFDTDAAKYKCTTRFLVWGGNDWRGWTGSNPS